MLGDLRKRLANRRISVAVTERARRFIAEEGFDPAYCARPLRRFITPEVETRLGRALLRWDLAEGGVISIDVADGELTVTALAEPSPGSAVT